MAVEDPDEPNPSTKTRKRKREQPQRKLLVNDKVEVRSVEDGFFGSWHSGVVIACESKRGHCYRHVRYDHLLADDESGKLVDVVAVSPILDGIDSSKRNLDKNYRGNIRPSPPDVRLKHWSLHYGLCVDACYNDAWWEGVVFDYDDGSPERRIFFPDLGDEMNIEICSLRSTQDWNEVTECWKFRGNWIFLELIEQFEKESCLPVSVKQIWYDIREKKDFKKVKEWTCTEKDLWKKMVCEVIDDYLNIMVKELCPTSELSEDALPEVMAELESAQPVKDVNMDPEAEVIGSNAVLPFDNPVNSDLVIDQRAIVMSALESAQLNTDVNMDPEAEVIVSRDVLPVENPVNNDGVIDQEEIVKNAVDSAQPGTDVNMYPGAEMKDSYAFVPVNNPLNSEREANAMNVNDCTDRITNESLQICDVAAPKELDMDPLTSMVGNDESNMNLLADSNISYHNKAFCMLPQALPMSTSNHDGISTTGSDSHGVTGILSNTSDTISGKCKNQARSNLENWLPFSSEMLHRAESCPEAVDEYYDYFCSIKTGKTKNLRSIKIAVWKHLVFLGWECQSSNKTSLVRRRYTSPDGKCFHSLFQVCQHLKESTRDTASQDDPRRLLPLSIVSPRLEQPEESLNPDCYPQSVVFPCFSEDNKPDCGHHSVLEYFLHSCKQGDNKSKSELISKAKNYLFDVGWKAGESHRSTGQKILHYKSPTGKVYYSVKTACKAYLFEENFKTAPSACRLAKSLNVTGETEGCSTSNMPSPMISGLDFQQNLVQPNILSKKLSGEFLSVAGLSENMKSEKVKVQGIRKSRGKRNHNLLDDAPHVTQARQNKLHARRDGLKNSSKKDGKLSQSKNKKSSLLKVKRSKKSGALINLRNAEDDTQPKRVLRSSKRVQEVAIPNSSHRNPRTVLSWLIDNNMVLPRAKVQYRSSKDQCTMAEGRITRNGIRCSCCQKLFTLIGFEVHARSKYNRPAANIFLEDGRSLLDCQRQIINNDNKMQSLATESHDRMKSNWQRGENDYICSVCHYGGELMLCDGCPSSFHNSCLGLKDIPDGDWFCPSCCCGICGEGKFQDQEDKEHTRDGNLICTQCERKYHAGCVNDEQADKLENCHAGNWFCTKNCEKLFLGLQNLLGKSFQVGADSDNLSWCLLKYTKTDSHSTNFTDKDDKDGWTEIYSKLNVALGVMHECFEPVKEPRTGRDLVEDIIFNEGSDLKRLNFKGFYTVLLVKDDELITVATVRVYGQKVAEVPLVGTRFQFRRLGMCRILMNELEKKLKELGVERLVLPAVPSVLNTWTTSFGFSQMTASERLQFLHYTFLDFQDTIMCQKLLMSTPSAELSTFKRVQPIVHGDINEAGDNIDCDRFSAVSEVYQAEQIEDDRIVDQGQLDISADNNCDSINSPTDIVVMVKQAPKPLECGPCAGETSQEFSMKDANLRREYDTNDEFYLKRYKRRGKPTTGASVNIPAFA